MLVFEKGATKMEEQEEVIGEDPQIFDQATLGNIGLGDPREQKFVACVLNSCASFVAKGRLRGLCNLSNAMKRTAAHISRIEAELHVLKASPKRAKASKDPSDQATVTKEQLDQALYEKKTASEIIAIKTKECDALKLENEELKKKLKKRDVIIEEQKKKMENQLAEYQGKFSKLQFNASNALREKDIAHSAALAAAKGSITAFHDPASSTYAICPIPTRDGQIVPLSNIIKEWRSSPGDNEGEMYATFRCNVTGLHTAVASMEQVSLIRRIGQDIGINITSPFVVMFKKNNDPYTEIPFFDQLKIIARICKLYRRRQVGSPEHVVIMGLYVMLIQLIQPTDVAMLKVDLQMMDCKPNSTTAAFHVITILNDATLFPEVSFVTSE